MNIIGNKKKFILLSIVVVALSVFSILFFGFNLGIDFQSGSLWQIKIPNTTEADIRILLKDELNVQNFSVSYDDLGGYYSITLPKIDHEQKISYFNAIKERFGEVEEVGFWMTSPTISEELKNKAFLAIFLVLLVISLYVSFVFRKTYSVISSYKYGIVTLVALGHDVIIAAGFFAVLAYFEGLVVDTNFVVALLIIMGFSVHDTIVVFDRIRENLLKYKNEPFSQIVNKSINETMRRSINTSLTMFFVLLSIYVLGPKAMGYFALTILVGTTVGTYSSIFLASPLLVVWQSLDFKKKK
ncbi:MAG: protein translocase subunit SecF [Candidatus Liptonbacteria bacterium]|nr:protein translocase subunit SecF [Candidatus Liptonbacteria bacterium]